MKKLVVYKSSTGFTKQYAEWICEACDCEAKELKKVSADEISQYDMIIYGGWIMGGMIMGLEQMRKMSPKKLVVFAVGATPDSESIEQTVQEQNQLDSKSFFYMQSGFHFEELAFPKRMMLKMLQKSTANKENKTEQEQFMAEKLGTTFDNSDKKYIQALVDYVMA